MKWDEFRTTVYAKFVLAGEHSVLRGVTAIALPLAKYKLNLSFKPDDTMSSLNIIGATEIESQKILQAVSKFAKPAGKLCIDSTIPIGAGLGSSAALCVALTKWLAEPLDIPKEKWFEFATRLENKFHGKSSGMDVATVLENAPISFTRILNEEAAEIPKVIIKKLEIKTLPKFTFHDTGLRASTLDCIDKVKKLGIENPNLARKTDEMMATASETILNGLLRSQLDAISKGMSLAQKCFYSWGLVPQKVAALEYDLIQKGALSVKLTGSGNGGMLVALW